MSDTPSRPPEPPPQLPEGWHRVLPDLFAWRLELDAVVICADVVVECDGFVLPPRFGAKRPNNRPLLEPLTTHEHELLPLTTHELSRALDATRELMVYVGASRAGAR